MYHCREEQRDIFRLRRITIIVDGKVQWNKYECYDCKRDGREHEVVEEPDGVTDNRSCWGPGIPTTKNRCTCCNREDGPWVSSSIVGGGW